MAGDRKIIDLDVVIRQPPDGQRSALGNRVLLQSGLFKLQKEFCHLGVPPDAASSHFLYHGCSSKRSSRQVMLSSPPPSRAACTSRSQACCRSEVDITVSRILSS